MIRSAARVLANDPLSPTVRRLRVLVEDAAFVYAPGQAVVLELPAAGDTPAQRTPYSIASAPDEHGAHVIEIAVGRDEEGESSSRAVQALGVGTALTVEGPVGSFVRTGDASGAPTLFVAGGTGLSPLRAMLAHELRLHPTVGPKLVLLYGVRTEDDILWRRDIETWAVHSPRFTPVITLSRGGDAWHGRRGWVQAHLEHAVALASTDAFAFVCGPEPMVIDVMRVLAEKHLPAARVLRERYG